ncbi:MAG TPA: glycosyltransferase [Gemmatimonadaceae bacterium]|nr:glycosyltransferase [Gemmatimonadaceae bacterium]
MSSGSHAAQPVFPSRVADGLRVAIVHDYLNQAGGAERVLATIHKMFPSAPIYTTLLDRNTLWPELRDADIRTSWMQRLPGVKRHFKKYLPLYPRAIESFDLSAYDLVVSTSSAWAKGAIVRPGAVHVCYCHTPMRFVWDYERYVARERFGRLTRLALPLMIDRLRAWDERTTERAHVIVANSSAIADRVSRCWGRDAEVVFPPVDVARRSSGGAPSRVAYHLVVSRLAPYKRVDLAVEAFTRAGRQLVVVGDGPDRVALERRAGPTVRFMGRIGDDAVSELYAGARGVIFPGEEDFGIVPLEANASGRPVIAYRAGGALDTVVDGRTGVFFDDPTPESLMAAVARAESIAWDPRALRRHAEGFGEGAFVARFEAVIARALAGRDVAKAAA